MRNMNGNIALLTKLKLTAEKVGSDKRNKRNQQHVASHLCIIANNQPVIIAK